VEAVCRGTLDTAKAPSLPGGGLGVVAACDRQNLGKERRGCKHVEAWRHVTVSHVTLHYQIRSRLKSVWKKQGLARGPLISQGPEFDMSDFPCTPFLRLE